jgi:hypothetical protein
VDENARREGRVIDAKSPDLVGGYWTDIFLSPTYGCYPAAFTCAGIIAEGLE